MLGAQVLDAANRRCGADPRFSSVLLLVASSGFLTSCGPAISQWASEAAPGASTSADVSLAWDRLFGAANLAGYRVYYGTAPGIYGQALGQGVDAKNVTAFTVTGLKGATKYYFVVTAYDTSNIESGFSNEVSKSIP